MSVVKPKPKQLLWPITSGAANPMNQSELKANTWNRHHARENVCEKVTMVLVLLLICWESGARFMANHITYEQCKTKAIAKLLSTALPKGLDALNGLFNTETVSVIELVYWQHCQTTTSLCVYIPLIFSVIQCKPSSCFYKTVQNG